MQKNYPKRTLTSWNLPLSAFPNAKSRWWSAKVDHDTPVEHKEDHLHLPRILNAFGASWWHFYHTGAKEVSGERFSEFEFSTSDVAHFDSVKGICNI